MKKKNSRIIILPLIVMVFVASIFIVKNSKTEKEVVKSAQIEIPYIENIHITSKSIILWDGDFLYYYTKDGKVIKEVDRGSENLELFFAGDYSFLYDADLNRVYKYSDKGDLMSEIKVSGEVNNISFTNKNYIFHLKTNSGENLAALTAKDQLEMFYETQNYILSYDIVSPGMDFIVTELSTSAMGYNTSLFIFKNKEIKKMDYQGEVALYCKLQGKEVLLFTEKNYYRITSKDVVQKEIPIISDIFVDKKNIYILHSGVLSRYTFDFKEVSKNIVAANANNIVEIGKEIYLYGLSDVAGNIGKENEFYSRLENRAEKVLVKDTTIVALKREGVDIYKIENKKTTDKKTVPSEEVQNEKVMD